MTFYLHPYPYRRLARRWAESNEHSLGVNVREEDEAYFLSALVPGLNAEDLRIQVLDDIVRIEGEYKADENTYLVHELPRGAFTARCVCLPPSMQSTWKRRSTTAS